MSKALHDRYFFSNEASELGFDLSEVDRFYRELAEGGGGGVYFGEGTTLKLRSYSDSAQLF